MNAPNKLECLYLASLSILVLCNTKAYWVSYEKTQSDVNVVPQILLTTLNFSQNLKMGPIR